MYPPFIQASGLSVPGFQSWCLLLWCLTTSQPLLAETVAISASKDNTLYSEAANSNGQGAYLFAGETAIAGTYRRALLAFDVSGAIPPGSTIQQVELQLHMSRTSTGTKAVSLHRLTRDWGEGTSNAPQQEGSGAPATEGDATWEYAFYSSSPWTTPGADFDPSPSAATDVSDVAYYSWTGASMISDVQDWLENPTLNYGWILIGQENGQSAKRFDSRENSITEFRPLLTITYDAPASLIIERDADSLLVTYSGTLQESTDLAIWTTLNPQPASPFSFSLSPGEKRFYRLEPAPVPAEATLQSPSRQASPLDKNKARPSSERPSRQQ